MTDQNIIDQQLNSMDIFEQDELDGKYFVFSSADVYYSLELEKVLEILQYQRITKIPCTDKFVKGVINLRGKVVPVIDIRTKFGTEPKESDNRTCIIIMTISEVNIGIIVDTVCEVATVKHSELRKPPKNLDFCKQYISSVFEFEDRIALLIDFNKFFADNLSAIRM